MDQNVKQQQGGGGSTDTMTINQDPAPAAAAAANGKTSSSSSSSRVAQTEAKAQASSPSSSSSSAAAAAAAAPGGTHLSPSDGQHLSDKEWTHLIDSAMHRPIDVHVPRAGDGSGSKYAREIDYENKLVLAPMVRSGACEFFFFVHAGLDFVSFFVLRVSCVLDCVEAVRREWTWVNDTSLALKLGAPF